MSSPKIPINMELTLQAIVVDYGHSYNRYQHEGHRFSARDSKYRQVSNIRRTLVGNKIVDNSDVVGASPVGAAPTTSSLST